LGALELLIDAPASGEENMRRDLELLEQVVRGESPGAVRLYGFSPPCLSLGRLQSVNDVDLEACRRDGIDVVRRPTGGRAVLHDAEVTYSVTCRTSDGRFGGTVSESCARIHGVLASALRALGIEAVPSRSGPKGRHAAIERYSTPDCFARPAPDELIDLAGRKVIGSAQARRAGGLLQHGSVPLEAPRTARYLVASERSVPPRAAGIWDIVGARVGRAEVVAALADAFRNHLSATP